MDIKGVLKPAKHGSILGEQVEEMLKPRFVADRASDQGRNAGSIITVLFRCKPAPAVETGAHTPTGA